MPSLATLRLTWERRVLSILRIMVGMLYMEHGFAKILDFPHQSTHVPYAPFTLNPGLQGLLEFVGGLLLALGFFTPSPLSSQVTWQWPTSWPMRQEVSSRSPTAGSWQSSTASSFSIFRRPGAAHGASTECERPRRSPPYRRAGPEHHRYVAPPRGC